MLYLLINRNVMLYFQLYHAKLYQHHLIITLQQSDYHLDEKLKIVEN